uniref:Uncharacterized protein n=1 Tax=Dulem virus 42 TaxID=3145760 RepID=A0AAU8BA25_9CAUD
MKKILITAPYTPILVDFDNQSAVKLEGDRNGIAHISIIQDDCVVVTGNGEYATEAKKNDILVSFYEQIFKKPFVVINSKDWLENLIEYNNKINNKDNDKKVEDCESAC